MIADKFVETKVFPSPLIVDVTENIFFPSVELKNSKLVLKDLNASLIDDFGL